MKKTILMIVIGHILFFLCSCTTQLHVRPYDRNSGDKIPLDSGLVFSLPRTYLKATISYDRIVKEKWKADDNGTPLEPRDEETLRWEITKPVELTTVTVPDPNLVFIADITSLRQFWAGIPEANFTLTEEGVLHKVNAQFQDKTAEIITWLAKTGFKIPKTTATLRHHSADTVVPDPPDHGLHLHNHQKSTPTNGKEQRYVYVLKRKEHVVERVLDISDFNRPLNSQVFVWEDKDHVPNVVIELVNSTDIKKSASLSSSDLFDCPPLEESVGPKSCVAGIPYRVPLTVQVRVKINNKVVQNKYFIFAQAGSVAVLPVYNKAFSDSTTAFEISTKTGAIKSLTLKTSSTGEKKAMTASDLSELIKKELENAKSEKNNQLTERP